MVKISSLHKIGSYGDYTLLRTQETSQNVRCYLVPSYLLIASHIDRDMFKISPSLALSLLNNSSFKMAQ